ncbi:MAG: hypothetical protein H6703_05695 [Myxococcales bacterium]|nr:hypothetical protein [Myxococcales bacterium]
MPVKARIPLAALLIGAALAACAGDDTREPAHSIAPADAGLTCLDGEERPCPIGADCVGRRLCRNGRFGACQPPPERCNDRDDDCDGATDEDWPLLGEPCAAGEGACRGDGVQTCAEDGADVTCDAIAAAPAPESCDGQDDDCDGAIDEAIAPIPCAAGVGRCRAEGTATCVTGEWRCDATPGQPEAETCDGRDDDCDDRVDEETADIGLECETDQPGICAAGRRTCDAGAPRCRPVTAGGAEACNGLDDDCDGRTDELYPIGDACTAGQGRCAAAGAWRCDDRGEARCDAVPGEPAPEACNGEDDDCDGRVDEGLGLGEACPIGVGACRVDGVIACQGGLPACVGDPGEPRDETCNALDDDCDGETDEALGLGAPCERGVGACARAGRGICGDDGAIVCDATPAEPTAETCNALDDDCDGRTDEGHRLGEPCAVGVGACARPGAITCADDGATRCDATPGEPAQETCDARDDDCDGFTDEGYPIGEPCAAGLGACRREGALTCEGGGPRCDAAPGIPGVERCNGEDDDCDGRADEGLGLGEICAVGRGACRREAVVTCRDDAPICPAEPGAPAPERCEGTDEDCDGLVDEAWPLGAACTVGLGACARPGVFACAAFDAACDATPGDPGPELCNGADDDCDGRTDEVLSCTVYRSCEDARAAGQNRTGAYLILDPDGLPRSAHCDQSADGGGWTLVAASRGAPPSDARAPWHPDLQSPLPAAARPGVWNALRNRTLRHDVRFVCHARHDAPATVDLSFYNVTWYREFTTGTDADSCFSEADGRGATEPEARRDNLRGAVRAVGQGRGQPQGDWFEGEDACAAADDFALDFDGRALGEGPDPTDWGLFDGLPRCGDGPVAPDARWLVYAREPRAEPLGRVALIGPAAIAAALAGSGFATTTLPAGPVPDLNAYDVVFIGRLALDWPALPPGLEAALELYNRTGGAVVTEYDGLALLGRGYAPDFVYAQGAPAPWRWLPYVTGGGDFAGLLPLRAVTADPIVRSLPDGFSGRAGPGFFFRPEIAGAVIRPITVTPIAGVDQTSTFRAVRCGGNLIIGTGSYADGAREAVIGQYIRNLAATAASPPPADLPDVCP